MTTNNLGFYKFTVHGDEVMKKNETIQTLMHHRSIRKYTNEDVDRETIETIVAAGQQAAFAYQIYSIILSRQKSKNPFKAPVLLTICVDLYKFERIMEKRGWKRVQNDLSLLMFGIEDASYMAQNIVIAAESMGLGTCYLGSPIWAMDKFAKKMKLPKRVVPIVQITIGHPAEDPKLRPRYPLKFTLFENTYPKELDIEQAMKIMDEGYVGQQYYKKAGYMIDPTTVKEEDHSFDNYGWTEHISRKLGLWMDDIEAQKALLRERGFDI
jgi:FMN reductase (NADPH)